MSLNDRLDELESRVMALEEFIRVIKHQTNLPTPIPLFSTGGVSQLNKIPCAYENVKPGTPMGLVCYCPKCSTTCSGAYG